MVFIKYWMKERKGGRAEKRATEEGREEEREEGNYMLCLEEPQFRTYPWVSNIVCVSDNIVFSDAGYYFQYPLLTIINAYQDHMPDLIKLPYAPL